MSKNKKNKAFTIELSLFQTIALLLAFIGTIVLCYVLYQKLPEKKLINNPTIVITEDTKNSPAEAQSAQDILGDFIFDHEYFTADKEALDFDIENLDETIDEIEKLIIETEKQEKLTEAKKQEESIKTEEYTEITEPEEVKETTEPIKTETTEKTNKEIKEETIEETQVKPEPETEAKEEPNPNLIQNTTLTPQTEEILLINATETHQTPKASKPLIAIIIDDMGINKKRTLDIISLNAPLTSSFLTYGNNLEALAQKAQASGHEIMLHAPMEPKTSANLAPDTLKTDMSKEDIDNLFTQMLKKFENIEVSGVNNHMGSKFTEDKERLGYIMETIKNKGMFFIDSKTSAASKGKEIAIEQGAPFAQRDVFLDNENNYDYIIGQLKKAEHIALKKGYAIAICHPKSQTFLALKDWLSTLENKNIELVHTSKIVNLGI